MSGSTMVAPKKQRRVRRSQKKALPSESQVPPKALTVSDYVKTGLKNHGSDDCMRHMLQHTAAVVNSVRVVGVNRYTGERGDSEVPGTGCPMRWGKHRFVLSAAHVFENAEAKEIRVLVFADLPKEYKSREALTKRDIVDGIGLTDDSVIHRCKWEDLAVVTVDVDMSVIRATGCVDRDVFAIHVRQREGTVPLVSTVGKSKEQKLAITGRRKGRGDIVRSAIRPERS